MNERSSILISVGELLGCYPVADAYSDRHMIALAALGELPRPLDLDSPITIDALFWAGLSCMPPTLQERVVAAYEAHGASSAGTKRLRREEAVRQENAEAQARVARHAEERKARRKGRV